MVHHYVKHMSVLRIIILHGLGNTLLNCSLADECQLFYLRFTQRYWNQGCLRHWLSLSFQPNFATYLSQFILFLIDQDERQCLHVHYLTLRPCVPST